MTLYFGLDFDGPVHRTSFPEDAVFMGPRSFLKWLEAQLGLSGHFENADYLRIELYRQALQQHLSERHEAFFAKSFEADRFATAQGLLGWRDELLSAGWAFETDGLAPNRLNDLAAVESIFQRKIKEPKIAAQAFGPADRWKKALEALRNGRRTDLVGAALHESLELLPNELRHVFSALEEQGVSIGRFEESAAFEPSTLRSIAKSLENQRVEHDRWFEPDGSFVILKTPRETDAAAFIAQFLRENASSLAPVFLVPELNASLSGALTREGFAELGILSASLARPALQLLKLAPAFVWEPLDVNKLLEFSTLALKPLDDGLANTIARLLAEKPGLENDAWIAATRRFFEESSSGESAKKQFDFWFSHRRWPIGQAAPKTRIRAIYDFIKDWASALYDEKTTKQPSLLALAEQARRIVEVLDALPETQLGFLELERIVRTVYQPSPTSLGKAERGHFGFVHQSGGLASSAETVVWWNFVHAEPTRAPMRWRSDEKQFLEARGIRLDGPERQNRLNRWRQLLPVLRSEKRLILVVPTKIEGDEQPPNLFMGDLEAIMGDLNPFIFDIEKAPTADLLTAALRAPKAIFLEKKRLPKIKPFAKISLPDGTEAEGRNGETLTSLEQLFFYPHRWFLRSKARLRPAPILSVAQDRTLLGNLAHRFFEALWNEDFKAFDRKAMEKWLDRQAPRIFEREGAPLLLYGREPERQGFLSKLKSAAWSLSAILKDNGWDVLATEQELTGEFCGIELRCKPDLVLQRGSERAIIDLKWSGFSQRKDMIKNGEDVQLVAYAKLLQVDAWPHTAYFIIESGKILARNAQAFRQALTPGFAIDDHEAACENVFSRMEKTFRWRMAQLERGDLEIRTNETAPLLELLYENEPLLDLFEMRAESSRWDEFGALIR